MLESLSWQADSERAFNELSRDSCPRSGAFLTLGSLMYILCHYYFSFRFLLINQEKKYIILKYFLCNGNARQKQKYTKWSIVHPYFTLS